MLKREMLYPLAILAGGTLFGAMAATALSDPGWPIAIVLAAIVILTLAFHVCGVTAATENPEAGKIIAARGRSTMVATGMVVTGIALMLGTCAPGPGARGMNFGIWFGWATLVMGLVLTYATGLVGRSSVSAEVTLLRGRRE